MPSAAVTAEEEYSFLDIYNTDQEFENSVLELKQAVLRTRFHGFSVVRTDPNFLKKFIRTKDGNVEEALKSMKKYYACIRRNSSFIKGITPRDLTDAFYSGVISVLRNSWNGAQVIIVKIGIWNPEKIDLRTLQLAIILIGENLSWNPITQKHGFALIADLQGLGIHHARRISPMDIYRSVNAVLSGNPLRIHSAHFLHAPAVFTPIYQVALRFIKKKIRDRFHWHCNTESLHQYFSKEELPVSLSGNLSDDIALNTEITKDLLRKNVPYEDYWSGTGQHYQPSLFI